MASTGEVWKLGHRPALDGLRGVAILLVVTSHLPVTAWVAAGTMGVTGFFTLSGFLITALLLEEDAASGAIRLGAFYGRRLRRLAPALLVFLAVMAAAGATLGRELSQPAGVLAALLYAGNWAMALEWGYLGGLAHTWSLSVEEQFYLLWPLLVVVVLRRGSLRVLAWASAVGAVASVVARLLLWDGGLGMSRVYFGTDTHADGLLVGCLLAVWMHQRQADARHRPIPLAFAGAAGVALLAQCGAAWGYVALPTLVPVLTGVAIWAVTQGGYRGWLEARWLVLLGRRSYGLYLWHYPLVVVVAADLPGSRWTHVPWLLAAAWGLTVLSWRFVESPTLHTKARGREGYTTSSHESTVRATP